MRSFDEYCGAYEYLRMSRDDSGILEIVLHSDGDSLRWGIAPHRAMTEAFREIALDPDNRVIVLTGTGDEFVGPKVSEPQGGMAAMMDAAGAQDLATMWLWDGLGYGLQLLEAMLDLPVPVICAVNGPVRRHGEIALLGDIVVASETASFEDSAHFELQDMVPGDGIHVVATMLLGVNRARAFMLTGEPIDAREALSLGLVKEVLPGHEVLERARELARRVAAKSDSTIRFTRALLVQPIKKQMLELAGMGIAYEGMAALARRRDVPG